MLIFTGFKGHRAQLARSESLGTRLCIFRAVTIKCIMFGKVHTCKVSRIHHSEFNWNCVVYVPYIMKTGLSHYIQEELQYCEWYSSIVAMAPVI